ncbi:hypothetical protein G4V62_00860 [Bacillaceae bacterium SIJ1]|uniref:hypothetical protein n=1 Tax=Litoribacterium kuwaitense TaxID=1398745 RepID=UPI0013EE3A16|nr:hypothetical protein [Litoribacterium kuwaitense]NGP43579.1 hypothetical protein [Litoribacterium kuwaitense]
MAKEGGFVCVSALVTGLLLTALVLHASSLHFSDKKAYQLEMERRQLEDFLHYGNEWTMDILREGGYTDDGWREAGFEATKTFNHGEVTCTVVYEPYTELLNVTIRAENDQEMLAMVTFLYEPDEHIVLNYRVY